MSDKGTEPRKVLSWGKSETVQHVPKPLIVAGWICALLVYLLNIPFFSALAVWVLLAISIVLIRDENRLAKINGWIFLALFTLKFLAMVAYMFFR